MFNKMINQLPQLLFLLLLLPVSLCAQDNKVLGSQQPKPMVPAQQLMRGTVVDESGQPLPGAKVQLVSRVPKFQVISMAVTDVEACINRGREQALVQRLREEKPVGRYGWLNNTS